MATQPQRRFPLPTERALFLAVAVAATGMAAAVAPPMVAVWRIAVIALVILLLADLLMRPAKTAVEARRVLPPSTQVGRKAQAVLRLENRTAAALQVRVRVVWPAGVDAAEVMEQHRLAAHATTELPLTFVPLRRGQIPLPTFGLSVRGPLGLIEHVGRLGGDDLVRSSPGRPAGEVAVLLARAAALQEVGSRRTHRRGSEWEFDSLREYVIGDEPRHLDWKASARRSRPTVRVFQEERNAELVLALDCGRLMHTTIDGVRKVDLAMTPLLDVAAVALRRRERVGLLVFDRRVRAYVPPAAGMPQLGLMTKTLADLDDADEPTSHLRAVSHLEARQRRRSLIIVFTDFTDELSAREMYASLSALARRHVLVFVGVNDPFLAAALRAPAPDARTAYQRAAAARLLAERRRTLERIQRLGIHALDADPFHLGAPLLARYLAVRAGDLR